VASEALDPEKMWRNHFEDLLNDNKRKFDERLQGAETNFIEKEQKLQEEIKLTLAKIYAQLNFAKSELIITQRRTSPASCVTNRKLRK
jgi:hypothetical protein